MHRYTVSDDGSPSVAELVTLYSSVGWTTYSSDPSALARAVAGSSAVLTARDEAGLLVGLARAISDDASICYLQDILVRPSAQRSGVGRGLVERMLARFGHVRQVVLLTDDEAGQRAFYEALGFSEAHDVTPNPLRAFVRIG
jgi:GNAT superfamily N-acetyltransferase